MLQQQAAQTANLERAMLAIAGNLSHSGNAGVPKLQSADIRPPAAFLSASSAPQLGVVQEVASQPLVQESSRWQDETQSQSKTATKEEPSRWPDVDQSQKKEASVQEKKPQGQNASRNQNLSTWPDVDQSQEKEAPTKEKQSQGKNNSRNDDLSGWPNVHQSQKKETSAKENLDTWPDPQQSAARKTSSKEELDRRPDEQKSWKARTASSGDNEKKVERPLPHKQVEEAHSVKDAASDRGTKNEPAHVAKTKETPADHKGESQDQRDSSSKRSGSPETSSKTSGAAKKWTAASFHVVGSFNDWSISTGHTLPCSVAIRWTAPKARDGDLRREEFQILGDSSWDKRVYPAGGEQEENVDLRFGQPSPAAEGDGNSGHGRNWVVQGRANTSFQISYDVDKQVVVCKRT